MTDVTKKSEQMTTHELNRAVAEALGIRTSSTAKFTDNTEMCWAEGHEGPFSPATDVKLAYDCLEAVCEKRHVGYTVDLCRGGDGKKYREIRLRGSGTGGSHFARGYGGSTRDFARAICEAIVAWKATKEKTNGH